MNKSKYVMVIPVWGQNHMRIFLDICIPSLLADNNIPYLVREAQITLILFIKKSEEDIIKSHMSIKKLASVIGVEYHYIDFISGRANHDILSDCHRKGLHLALDRQAYAILPTPDCVFSNNSLRSLHQLVIKGIKFVHMTYVRLQLELVYSALTLQANDNDGILSIDAPDLVDFSMQRFHSIMKRHVCNDFLDCKLLAANFFWKLDNSSMLAHCFHLHPILIKPGLENLGFKVTIDDDLLLNATFAPHEVYIVQDSDEMLAYEISSDLHFIEGTGPKDEIEHVIRWARYSTNAVHKELVRTPIFSHGRMADRSKWNDTCSTAFEFVDLVLHHLTLPEVINVQQNSTDTRILVKLHKSSWNYYCTALDIIGKADGLISGKITTIRKWHWMYLVEHKVYKHITRELISKSITKCFVDDQRKLFFPYLKKFSNGFTDIYTVREDFLSPSFGSDKHRNFDLIAIKVNSNDIDLINVIDVAKRNLNNNGKIIIYCFCAVPDWIHDLEKGSKISVVNVSKLGGLGCKIALAVHSNMANISSRDKCNNRLVRILKGIIYKLLLRSVFLPIKFVLYPIVSLGLFLLEAI